VHEESRGRWLVRLALLGAALVVVSLGVVVVGLVVSARMVRAIEAQVEDPTRREAVVRAALGIDRLPQGYHAAWSLDVPLTGSIVLLTSEPAEVVGRRGRPPAGLVAVARLPSERKPGDERSHAWYSGRRDEVLRLLALPGYELATGSIAGRGTRSAGAAELRWLAFEATLGHLGAPSSGLLLVAEVRCPVADDEEQVLVWFRSGHALDEDGAINGELEALAAPLDLCGG
jgi:hypothetical protein